VELFASTSGLRRHLPGLLDAETLAEVAAVARDDGGHAAFDWFAKHHLPGLGVAFATKHLFFCAAAEGGLPARVLDRLVRGWLARNAGWFLRLDWRVTDSRDYVETVTTSASELDRDPAELEHLMFTAGASLESTSQWSEPAPSPASRMRRRLPRRRSARKRLRSWKRSTTQPTPSQPCRRAPLLPTVATSIRRSGNCVAGRRGSCRSWPSSPGVVPLLIDPSGQRIANPITPWRGVGMNGSPPGSAPQPGPPALTSALPQTTSEREEPKAQLSSPPTLFVDSGASLKALRPQRGRAPSEP